MRSLEDALGFLTMLNKKSSGDITGFAAAAASAAFMSAVFLFGVPRWRPPRLSPGFDPLGIAIFRRLYIRHVPLPGGRGSETGLSTLPDDKVPRSMLMKERRRQP
jgi:hypothetical protein